MNRKISQLTLILIVILALAATLGSPRLVTAQAGGSVALAAPEDTLGTAASTTLSTGFTYQGRLTDDGSPANGTYDFQFTLHDAQVSGSAIGSPAALEDVPVTEGLFTVLLDFGEVFDGTALWLAIGVRPGDETGAYTLLTPRQALTATPYALFARRAPWTGLTGVPAGFADGVDNNSGGDITAVTAGTGLTGGGTNGSVTLNVNESWFDNRYWRLMGNSGTDPATHFLGTTDNQALELHVNGARALRLEPNATSPNFIGGHSSNSVTAGVVGATIAGGGSGSYPNLVMADYATVGGGNGNDATGELATIGGGRNNDTTSDYATVGGGLNNDATGFAATIGGGYSNEATDAYATIGGGFENEASGNSATVAGGVSNFATGGAATVGGGSDNVASGDWSFAAGRRAQASRVGCFVWADSTNEDFPCSYDNQFRVRANGGATFLVDSTDWEWVRFKVTGGHLIDTSTDAHLTTGGVWTNGSDQAAKENFAPVDGQHVLAQLAAVPIQTWNYRAEDPVVRRMGPTAQDFYAAFGLGEDELHIATIDADGVALAAIQALYQRTQDLEVENADLEARLAVLEQAGGISHSPGVNLFGGWSLVGAVGLLVAAVAVGRRRFPGGGR